MPHLASGDIDVAYSSLPEGQDASVDATVALMADMAKGKFGARSPKIRAAAINIINGIDPISGERIGPSVANKDYFGMLEAIHNYVRDNIRYVKDVVGQETLSYPEEILFNSRAEDCDGMTTLEMALLGSIGIRSYPVVIGLVPNHFSHVYLHAEIPPGKHRYADATIAADPIMREWPLGKAAPADRVKAKRTYPELAGIGTMAIAGYASGPSYLNQQDELEATQVPAAMKSRYVDTGSRGEIVTTKRLTQWGDELDDMFNRAVNVGMPMQAAPAFSLYSRGPITNRHEKVLTSYLEQAKPVRRISAPLSQDFQRGRNIVTLDRKVAKTATVAPTVGELLGLSDYLTDLSGPAARAAQRHLVTGATDPIHRATAAAAYTKQRATKASGRVVRMEKNAGFLFGLGDVDSTRKLDQAKAIEQLAHEVAVKAQNLAEMCAGASPARQQAMRDDFAALDHLGHYLGVVDAVAQLDPADHPRVDAQNKVDTLTVVSQSPTFRAASMLKASPAMAQRAARPIVGILPGGAVVRDQNGDVLYADDGSDDLEGGLGSWFKKATSKVTNAVKKIAQAPVKAVQAVSHAVVQGAQSVGKVAEKDVTEIGKGAGKLARQVTTKRGLLAASTYGMSEIYRPLLKGVARGFQGKSGGAPAAPASPSVVTPTSTTPPDGTSYMSPPDPNQSVIPQPGESTASPNVTDPWSTYGQDEGYQGPSVEAESSQSMDQMSSGGGDGQSFTDTMTVDDSGGNPFADDASSGGGDDASEGSDDASAGGGDDASEGSDTAPAPRRRHKRSRPRFSDGQDSTDLDSSDVYDDADDGDGNEDGGEGDEPGSAEEPPIEGLPTVAGVSIGTLALVGLGAYLLLRHRK